MVKGKDSSLSIDNCALDYPSKADVEEYLLLLMRLIPFVFDIQDISLDFRGVLEELD
jgi:hypothetical protein